MAPKVLNGPKQGTFLRGQTCPYLNRLAKIVMRKINGPSMSIHVPSYGQDSQAHRRNPISLYIDPQTFQDLYHIRVQIQFVLLSSLTSLCGLLTFTEVFPMQV